MERIVLSKSATVGMHMECLDTQIWLKRWIYVDERYEEIRDTDWSKEP